MLQKLNTYWRILGTGFSFFIFGLGAVSLGLYFNLLRCLPFSTEEKRTLARNTITRACHYYIQMMRALGLLQYQLNVNLPKKGHIIVANHPTLLDAVFMLAANNRLCCIVKSALWHNPITAQAVRLAGYLPNDSDTFIDQAINKLEQGEHLLIFPEGTRTKTVSRLKFKRGAANVAIMGNCPIIPVTIHCDPITLQKNVPWYRVPQRKPLFVLQSHSPIHVAECIDTMKPRTVQYRHLTAWLEQYFQVHIAPQHSQAHQAPQATAPIATHG